MLSFLFSLALAMNFPWDEEGGKVPHSPTLEISAAQSDIPQRKEIEDVQKHLEVLVSQTHKPHEVLVVLDLHGTITSNESPQSSSVGFRKGSRDLLKYLADNKIEYIIASADKNTSAIKSTLDILNISCDPLLQKTVIEIENQKYEGYVMGPCASFRPLNNEGFYRHKAFSLLTRDMKNVKHVLFADDDFSNVSKFREDSALIYPQMALSLFHLSLPTPEDDKVITIPFDFDFAKIRKQKKTQKKKEGEAA